MVRLSVAAALLSGLGALADPRRIIKRGTFSQVTNSGISNPTNVGFYTYIPSKLATNPGIVVAIHYCTGSAQAYYSGSPYASLSETYGFVVIYPSSPYSGTCWDVSSKSALTHNGGGDSNSIANMVTWAISKYNADPSKVFVTGSSSGAMMTVREEKSRLSGFSWAC
jgi:acetylxylan esterase